MSDRQNVEINCCSTVDHGLVDWLREHIVTFAQAADFLPRRRRGRKVAVSTLYRWTVTGCRGIVLESVQIGGTRCTSKEALARFFDRLSHPRPRDHTGHPDSPVTPVPLGTRTAAQRRRAADEAGRRLERMGA
jgi:hypothetical protein